MITISDDIGKIVPVICVVRQIVDKQRIKPRPLQKGRGRGFLHIYLTAQIKWGVVS